MIQRTDIANNLLLITKQIEEAAAKVSKNIHDIELILVSKGQKFSAIKECYNLGYRDFGENYIKEWQEKYDLAIKEGLNDIKWHFLGNIQSNKIKSIVKFSVIHSVDSLKHAVLLNENVQNKKDIFIEIKLSSEEKKSGILENEIIPVIEDIKSLTNLNIRGLMTILPLAPKKPASFWLEKMLKLKENLTAKNILAKVDLSMGMSADFFEAIMHGASVIRVGTKVFGKRDS